MPRVMQLEKCPYDMSPISVRGESDSFVVSCDSCGGAWEIRGSSIRRLHTPDAATIKAVRERLFSPEALSSERSTAMEITDSVAR